MRRSRIPVGFFGALIIIVAVESLIETKRFWFLDEAMAMWEEKCRLIDEGAIHADILAFGSSRTMHGLVPSVIEHEMGAGWSCYNMGLSGMLTPGSAVQLHRVFEAGARPKIVVFELVAHHLDNAIDESLRPHHLRSLYRWPELAELLRWRFQPMRAVEWGLYAALPSARYRASLDNFISMTLRAGALPTFYHDRNLGIDDEFARNAGYRPWTLPEDSADGRNEPILSSLTIEPGVRHLIGQVVHDCRMHGARCVFVASPIKEDRLANLRSAGYIDLLNSFLNELDQTGKDVYAAPLFTFSPELFADATHLNRDGAPVFSREFGRWLADRRADMGFETEPMLARGTGEPETVHAGSDKVQ